MKSCVTAGTIIVQKSHEFKLMTSLPTKRCFWQQNRNKKVVKMLEKLMESSRAVCVLCRQFVTQLIPEDANPKQVHESISVY